MKSVSYRVMALFTMLSMLLAFGAAQPVLAAQGGTSTTVPLISAGTANLSSLASGPQASGNGDTSQEIGRNLESLINRSIPAVSYSPARIPASHVPTPNGLPVVTSNPGFSGFDGLTHRDQRLANNGNQFSLEPPDQALCVGNGFVVESVNTAIRVRATDGTNLTSPVAINPFFGLAPEIIRGTTPVFGDFTSDPKCLYDVPTGRFFLTVLQLDVNPATGDFTGPSSVLIAVSQTSDPRGGWNLYKLNTTNDGTNGTPSHPGCPCLGDQPLIGLDANGFYVSTNEFPLFSNGFNGAMVYAMSKTALAGGSMPTVVMMDAGSMSAPSNGVWYSLQPAATPSGHGYASGSGGTEYFLSALDFSATLDNRIAVWALTNTSSLNSASPSLSLTNAVLNSEVYGQPPAAEQMDGLRPLAAALGLPQNKLAFLNTNDDRMNQVVYVGGKLYSGVNSVLMTQNGPARSGIAYFIVSPSVKSGQVGGWVSKQGYVSVNLEHTLFPSIAVNDSGKGVMVFTLSGKDYFPSAAYVSMGSSGAGSVVHLAASGAAPEDGFTSYAAYGGNRVSRWGDYSAATVDEAGNLWMATEYIPNLPRTSLANWGSFIGSVAH